MKLLEEVAVRNKGITEKQFQEQIRDLAKLFGWKFYHPFLSKWSERGWPDVTLLRDGRLIIAELKTNKRSSKLSPAQAQWLWALRKVPGIKVYIWRPRYIEKIAEVLR